MDFQGFIDRNGGSRVRQAKNGTPMADIYCPRCQSDRQGAQNALAFANGGWKCFKCGAFRWADGAPQQATVLISSPSQPPKPAGWKGKRNLLAAAFEANPARLALWRGYKDLISPEMIRRHGLGIGVLPNNNQCQHSRLIIPQRWQGEIVGFRGRQLDCDCSQRWLSSWQTEVVPLFLDRWKSDVYEMILICENQIDALIFNTTLGRKKKTLAIAPTTGCGSWQAEWTRWIAAATDKVAIVFDNDLPGHANPKTREKLTEIWREEHGHIPPPFDHGLKLAADLQSHGVVVKLFEWPDGTPPKADLYHLLKGVTAWKPSFLS